MFDLFNRFLLGLELLGCHHTDRGGSDSGLPVSKGNLFPGDSVPHEKLTRAGKVDSKEGAFTIRRSLVKP